MVGGMLLCGIAAKEVWSPNTHINNIFNFKCIVSLKCFTFLSLGNYKKNKGFSYGIPSKRVICDEDMAYFQPKQTSTQNVMFYTIYSIKQQYAIR